MRMAISALNIVALDVSVPDLLSLHHEFTSQSPWSYPSATSCRPQQIAAGMSLVRRGKSLLMSENKEDTTTRQA
jgi:hypothetical protein